MKLCYFQSEQKCQPIKALFLEALYINRISLTIVSHDHSLMIQAHTQEYGNP